MKVKLFSFALTMLLVITFLPACSQTKDNKKQPDVRIKVNVQRDDKGNIIRYDSSYVMTWSSDNSTPEQIDSLMRQYGIQYNFDHTPADFDSLFEGFNQFPGMMNFGFDNMYHQFMSDSDLYSMHDPNAIIKEMEEMQRQMLKEMQRFEQENFNNIPPEQNDYSDEQNQKLKIKIEGTSI